MATYTSNTPGTYSPLTGANANVSFIQPVRAVLMDLTLQSNGLSLKYGTQIQAGDKEAYVLPPHKMGGTMIAPSPGMDTIDIGGVRYSIVTFKELNPTGLDPIVYFLYLRR